MVAANGGAHVDEQVLVSGRRAFPDYPRSVVAEPPQLTWLAETCRVWNVPPAPPGPRLTDLPFAPKLEQLFKN